MSFPKEFFWSREIRENFFLIYIMYENTWPVADKKSQKTKNPPPKKIAFKE